MKECRKCNKGFNPTSHQVKKSDFVCPECTREFNRAYRAKRKADGNPVISGKMDRKYHKIYEEEYYKNPEVKKRRAELMRKYASDPELRIKHVARWLTRRALKSGKIKKTPCETCGKKKVDAHHDDYFKPLEVRFLCRLHHNEYHKNAKAKGEA